MNTYRYKVIPSKALEMYAENGMETEFDEALLNGVLIVEAESEAEADKFRMTYTDIRMWEIYREEDK